MHLSWNWLKFCCMYAKIKRIASNILAIPKKCALCKIVANKKFIFPSFSFYFGQDTTSRKCHLCVFDDKSFAIPFSCIVFLCFSFKNYVHAYILAVSMLFSFLRCTPTSSPSKKRSLPNHIQHNTTCNALHCIKMDLPVNCAHFYAITFCIHLTKYSISCCHCCCRCCFLQLFIACWFCCCCYFLWVSRFKCTLTGWQ